MAKIKDYEKTWGMIFTVLRGHEGRQTQLMEDSQCKIELSVCCDRP